MSIGLTTVYRQRIEKEEKRIGEPLDLPKEMLKASPGMLTKYLMAAPLFAYGRQAPQNALHMVRIAALRAEDCGPCVDIGAACGRADGLEEAHLQTARRGNYDDLPHDLSLAAHFGDAISRGLPEAAALGEAVERAWGRAARVEMALAAATARIFPAMKRGLGMTTSCAVHFGGGRD